jgi:hypothetical protein
MAPLVSTVIHLPADPSSTPKARHFVGESLVGSDFEAARDAAELCVSELVTNAVLHAGTSVDVGVAQAGDGLRLWVDDSSPDVPRPSPHSRAASTGRGLSLVASISRCWGVERMQPYGKSVWCEIDGDVADRPDDVAALLGMWGAECVWTEPTETPEPVASKDLDADAGTLVLRGYPVVLGLRQGEQYASLLRECQLLCNSPSAVPSRLGELACAIVASHTSPIGAFGDDRLAAFAAGADTMDVTFPLAYESVGQMAAFRDVLVELNAYAADGLLLALPAPAEVTQLIDWIVDECVRQANGALPAPWDGPLR